MWYYRSLILTHLWGCRLILSHKN
uniref:Uncharacterized protein n=1 Tax=Anguilla anguilla TaxID=7936 RepID=A0A0E9RV79_ANGAN